MLAEFGLDEGKAPQGKAWGWWENKPRLDTVSEYLYASGRIMSRMDFHEPGELLRGAGSVKHRLNYHQDALGSTVMLTDGRGKVEQAYGYDAFGNPYEGGPRRGGDEHGVDGYLYNGKRYDAAVGLYDYGFRDYNPQLGRWTTPDPIKAWASIGTPT